MEVVTADGRGRARERDRERASSSGACAAAAATSASSTRLRVQARTRWAPRSSAARSRGAPRRRRGARGATASSPTDAPPELTCVAGLRKAPPAPWLPEGGARQADRGACSSATRARSRRASGCWRRSRRSARRWATSCSGARTLPQQSLLDATQPKGRRYYWKSEYLPGHRRRAARCRDGEHAAAHRLAALGDHLMFPFGGALERAARRTIPPVGNRDARSVLNVAASWEQADRRRGEHRVGARGVATTCAAFSTGGDLRQLPHRGGGERPHPRAAYGANYERLAAVKAEWDPTNLFQHNKNIPPTR